MKGIHHLKVVVDGKHHKVLIAKLMPIPITPEWLVKFGFYNMPLVSYVYWLDVNRKVYLRGVDKNGIHGVKLVQSGKTIIHNKIQYIHQLQNLYFTLTGTEL